MNQEKLSTRMNLQYHKMFIYGYNSLDKSIYVADHYDDGKYTTAKIGYEEFMAAYEMTYKDNLASKGKESIQEKHQIIIARPKFYKYNFNVDWFKIQLKDYLHSTYTLDCVVEVTKKKEEREFWGISCYEMINEYLERLLSGEANLRNDFRLFTIVADHKKLLKMRTEFFIKKGICKFREEEIRQYDVLDKYAESLLNNFIKYQVTGKKDILNRIKERLIDMKKIELKLLHMLQNKLDS